MNRFWVVALCLIAAVILLGCLGSEEEEEETYGEMCVHHIEGENAIEVFCQGRRGACTEWGDSTLAHYDDVDNCQADIDDVVDHYSQTGEIRPGPGSHQMGGGGSTGGGGATTNGGTSGGGDSLDHCHSEWNCAAEPQLSTICAAACAYNAEGHEEGRDASCQNLSAIFDSATNTIGTCCPVCAGY